MWTLESRDLTFNGTVLVDLDGSGVGVPLQGVRVDVFQFTDAGGGSFQFQQLNQAAARTDPSGDFDFTNVSASVLVQYVTSSIPPYPTLEIIDPNSLPNLAFRISVEAAVLGLTGPQGSQFVDIYDERTEIDAAWVVANPVRINVPLTGSPVITVMIPQGNEEASILAGISAAPPVVPGDQVHLLRVGRVTRDEITEMGPGATNVGYMNSAMTTFFPGVVDAPFGGTMHIGGHFGANFLPVGDADNLYYTLRVSEYTGSLTSPFDPAFLTNTTQILDPLYNKKYVLPTIALPKGAWQSLHMGPFNAEITAVDPGEDPALVGASVQVYKRPPSPNLATEYWPFWDLLAIWKSTAAPDALVVLTIDVYEQTGTNAGGDPELTKRAVATSVNDHLPMMIDNRRPVPTLFDWRTGFATYDSLPEAVSAIAPFDPCGEMPVTTGQVDSNECILLKYSIEDGAGNAHPHVNGYHLEVEYTPRQVGGAPLIAHVPLQAAFGSPTYDAISGSYSPVLATAPVYEVFNYESVLVPQNDDSWPPEPNGDPPSPCVQYAAEVAIGCSVRTINGWSRLYGAHSISRHIIIKR